MKAARLALPIFILLFALRLSWAEDDAATSGTGFFINNDGWIITAAHVVDDCEIIEVRNYGKAGRIVSDKFNDIGAIKLSTAAKIDPIVLRQRPPRLGEDVLALGFPLSGLLSDSVKLTTGNINSLAGIGNDTRLLQVSVPIQPGNSGGPLLDMGGQVVGIMNSSLAKAVSDKIKYNTQNVNFAIKASGVEQFLRSNGIEYSSNEVGDRKLSVADVAESIAASVVQVICYRTKNSDTAKLPDQIPAEDPSPKPLFSAKEIAQSFAHYYHDRWSSPNEEALPFMAGVYAEWIEFYGKEVPRSQLMNEKRQFAIRWPVRDYSIRDGSLRISCRGGRCSVTAIVDWFAYSQTRGRYSNGVASFDLVVDTENMVIISENGRVLSRGDANPSGMISRWYKRNADCRGGAGSYEQTQLACKEREFTSRSLVAAGWCYGREGEYGYQMKIHRCGPISLR